MMYPNIVNFLICEKMASSKHADGKFCFAIDRGGTFTDVWSRCPDGRIRILKLLSEDPQNYPDAPTEAIRRILEEETGRPHLRGQPVDAAQIGWIRMGTTVATNALLERKGERMALLVTEGFRDILQIGNQARPKIFDLKIEMPDLLYEQVIEVEERVILTNDDMNCEYPVLKESENRRKKVKICMQLCLFFAGMQNCMRNFVDQKTGRDRRRLHS